jgi:cation diffusion facilitator CzcD-associated flavoprotein CzcO
MGSIAVPQDYASALPTKVNSHTNGVSTNGSSPAYQISEEPSRTGRKIKVIVIGAGASALNFAHDVDTSHLDLDLVCYEKNPEIGGTWYENRYPGCGCDIPSVNYQFTWAPSHEWTSLYVMILQRTAYRKARETQRLTLDSYSSAPEILGYFKGIADKCGLRKYIRLNHKVVGAEWNEHDQQWHVKAQRGNNPEDVIEAKGHILINASGVLK